MTPHRSLADALEAQLAAARRELAQARAENHRLAEEARVLEMRVELRDEVSLAREISDVNAVASRRSLVTPARLAVLLALMVAGVLAAWRRADAPAHSVGDAPEPHHGASTVSDLDP